LVEEKIGITVDKGETRSNWIRRPLTDSQLNYAASDVEFLIDLFIEQKKSLNLSNKLEWHNEELDFLSSRIFSPIDYDEDINTGLTKAEEKNLLNKFNDIVLQVAELEKINPTMFFSKKSQKDFLRLTINEGFEKASSEIASWRCRLIAERLGSLLQDY
jgi:ribonuclease D